MVRQCLGLCVVLAVGGCTTDTENAPAVPDAGAIVESTTGSASAETDTDSVETDSVETDSEPADTTKPDSAHGDASVDASVDAGGLTNGASATSTSPSASQTSGDATSAHDDAGTRSNVSCDVRKLTCRRAEPSCDYGYVPRIIDGCYAECVRIDDCVCNGADACPQPERYTCNNSRQRCTPYLM